MTALADYLRKQFGGDFVVTANDVALVQNTPTQIAGSFFERLGLVFVNNSGSNVWVSPDSVPSATHGAFLAAGGGQVSINYIDDLAFVGYEWFAFTAGSGVSVHVQKVTRQTVHPA